MAFSMFNASNKGKIIGFTQFENPPDNQQEALTKPDDGIPDPDDNKYKKDTRKLTTWNALVVLVCLVAVFLLVMVMDRRLPQALTKADLEQVTETYIFCPSLVLSFSILLPI